MFLAAYTTDPSIQKGLPFKVKVAHLLLRYITTTSTQNYKAVIYNFFGALLCKKIFVNHLALEYSQLKG